MKFIMVIDTEPGKLADVANVSDRIWKKPPKGVKKLAQYMVMAPIPAHDPDRIRALAVLEAENEQALMSISLAAGSVGARVSAIPAFEYSVAPEVAKVVQELKRQASG